MTTSSFSTKPESRTEKDSLGDIQLPADALYGAQTQRAVNNFPLSGLRMPPAFIHGLGLLKHACASANQQLGLLADDIASAIQQAALAVASGNYDDEFPVDVFQTGSGTSTNMNANEVIAHLASQMLGQPVHPNDHVNRGQSSNDVIPSCIHIAATLQITAQLLPALEYLSAALQRKSTQYSSLVKTGRTHLMDAMPLTLGQEMSGWQQQLANSTVRITDSLARLRELAIGGTAVGTGINTDPAFSATVINVLNEQSKGQFRAKANYFEALSCQDAAVEMSGQLKTLAVSLMKIGNDLRWMNSGPLSGLAEIQLPVLQPGSSIMPGKVNPVVPEAITMVCAQVIGNDTTITVAGQSGNFQLNVMLPVIAYNLLQSIELLANAATLLADKVIDGFTANEDRIAATLTLNPVLITALNNVIGYDKGAQIVKRALQEQRPIVEVAADMTDLEPAQLAELLDPAKLV